MAQFIVVLRAELIKLINTSPAGRNALRIRPGATAVEGVFVDIRLRGGDVLQRGISDRDQARIDAWLQSPGYDALVRMAVARAWAIAGKFVRDSLLVTLRSYGLRATVTVSIRL